MRNDGIDYAAVLQTIIEIGDDESLHAAINDAFLGSRLIIKNDRSRFEVLLQQPGIKCLLEARELSDGILRYLYLIT
ncbi:MAG TPA: hypothetical protein PLD88_10365 [Candidatus Berkiella sp.]|nr:hypothetical protein [Candidatus Berkiella sp.]